jgi:hypothetical protein
VEEAVAQARESAQAARAQLEREDRERAEGDARRARDLRTLTRGLERLRDDGRALRVRLEDSLAAEREASRAQVAELAARLEAATGHAPADGRRAPWLARALPRFARSDPAAAAALLVGLLPVQRPGRALDYDLDVAEWGAHAVTAGETATSVRRLAAPRPDREVDFRLELDALALAELLVHGGPAARRRCERLTVRATRRRRRALRWLPPAALHLEGLEAAGVRPDPFLALGALCQLVEPEWTRGERLWVGWDAGPPGGAWYAGVQDGAPPVVTRTAPSGGPQAVVSLDAEAFHRVVLGGGAPHARGLAGLDRGAVRGDMRAVALLLLWLDWARAGGPGAPG